MVEIEIISKLKSFGVIPRLDSGELKLVGEVKNLPEAIIHEVRANKVVLIQFLSESLEDTKVHEPISKVEKAMHYPLSNAQKRIWILSQFEGGNEAYNICEVLHLKGKVNWEYIEESIQKSIERHESLRSIVKTTESGPVLVVQDKIDFELEFGTLDFSKGLEASVRKAEVTFRKMIFDLEEAPLFKMKVLNSGEDQHILMVNMHHVISDGWSAGILVQEILQNYEGLINSANSKIEDLKVQYKDYSQWLSQKIAGDFGDQARNFWAKKNLSSFAPITLPTDFQHSKINSFDGDSIKFFLGHELDKKIETFAKNSGSTLFNIYRAVISITLHKWTNQNEFIIGAPVAGRTHPDLEGLIGLFVNTIPLCSKFDPNQSFQEYLKEISADSLASFVYQDFPLDVILEEENISRNAGRNPLFDVMLVVHNNAINEELGKGNANLSFELNYFDDVVEIDTQFKENRSAKFDLSFVCSKRKTGENFIEIEYKSQLFEKSTIENFYKLLSMVLEQILHDGSTRLGDIEIVTAQERATLLTEFNKPIQSHEDKSIIGLLNNSLNSLENRTAMIAGERTFSYAEVNAEVNAVTNMLVEKELKKVGFLMSRSEKSVCSVIGALRAQVSYVPIDVNYPDQRIEYILEDAGIDTLLVDKIGTTKIPESFKGEIIPYADLEKSSTFQHTIEEDPLHTAYLIYTSGSTGKPKGVEISNKNVIAFLKWAKEEFENTPFDVMYAGTSYCFDLSVFEMLLPILLGKKLRILKDATETTNYINKDQAVFLNTVPSVVRNFQDLNMDWRNVVALNMAGEPIPKILKEQLDYNRIEVRNLYGPSEDTTYSTFYRFEDDGLSYIPIGIPVGDTQAYILNDEKQLLPIGVAGEIYLSGESVASGYYNKPELTNERFTINPFVEGKRMYKTGDLGKWKENGLIEFVGRSDDQVKVRGYRIELGEIQYQLERIETIKEAVVTINEIGDDKEIVAYFELTDGAELSADQIKENLKEKLPAYMVPGVFVELENIPLNSNGKVDKNRLPEPFENRVQEVIPAESRKEKKLLEIWEEILELKEFGITSNFFDLGGQSLKATQLKNRVSNVFLKELTLNEIFIYPTIREQIELLDTKEKKIDPKIEALISNRSNAFPLSYAQERLWILNSFEEVSKAYHMPAVFEVKGDLRLDFLTEALEKVVLKHEILRTVFAEVDGVPKQIVLHEDDFPVKITERHAPESADIKESVMLDWQETFNLESGPLWRTSYWKQGEKRVLSFNMHHIISDGWSIAVLFREVLKAYAQLLSGSEIFLGELELQYKDFAIWQRKELTEEVLAKQLAYWKDDVFGEGVRNLSLPYDRPRPQLKTYNGGIVKYTFSTELSLAIKKQAVDNGVSLFMGIMANVNLLLKKLSNENDITVGIPVVGRESSQLQELIGFFVNTLPIRTTLKGDQKFSDLLAAQRDQLIKAFEHQNFPFEKLVDEIQPKRDMSRSPLFDVMVTLQGFEVVQKAGLELDNHARLSGMDFGTNFTKYDITFSFSEGEDGINTELEFNTDLFDHSTIEKMVKQMVNLFEITTENSELQIDDISILDQKENELIKELAKSQLSSNSEESILSKFQSFVQNSPDLKAIKTGSNELTYKELDDKTSALSTWIRENHSPAKGEVIGILTDHLETVTVCILSILKSGAAYLLLDSKVPSTRNEWILKDANCKLVLIDEEEDAQKVSAQVEVLNVNEITLPTEVNSVEVIPSDFAYLVYSSRENGSLQASKVNHENAVAASTNDLFNLRSNSKATWAFNHAISQERTHWEIFGALLNGGGLVATNETNELLNLIDVNTLSLTGTELQEISKELELIESEIKCSWEKLILIDVVESPRVSEKLKKFLSASEVITTISANEAVGPILSGTVNLSESGNKILVKPVAGAHILDSGLNPCGIGVVGELHISGPILTSENEGNPQLYRTGNQARLAESGELELMDSANKRANINGYRVYSEEIVQALKSTEGVKNALVELNFQNPALPEIVAFVESNSELISETTLKENLEKVLPKYMVPTKIHLMEEFPLLSNGEIDEEEVIERYRSNASSGKFVGPRNDQDEKIIEIWEEVLGRKGIGIHDNFFDLGGHSLKATRVISKIQEVFDVKIELKDLFMDPTIENIGDYVNTISWVNDIDETSDSEGEELIF